MQAGAVLARGTGKAGVGMLKVWQTFELWQDERVYTFTSLPTGEVCLRYYNAFPRMTLSVQIPAPEARGLYKWLVGKGYKK
jgi:hypothetical protein